MLGRDKNFQVSMIYELRNFCYFTFFLQQRGPRYLRGAVPGPDSGKLNKHIEIEIKLES